MAVDLSSGQTFSPFGSNIFRGHQMRVPERGSGGPFLASQTPIFCQLTADREYLENNKLERYMSITA